MRYSWQVCGTASQGQTWEATGTAETEKLGDFMMVPDRAMRDAFTQLTQGKAVYGKPGVGCSGPYRVTRLLIEEEKAMKFEIIWPEQRWVGGDIIAGWYSDAVENQDVMPPYTTDVREMAMALSDIGFITVGRIE
jgi:hypothetical protein